MDSWLPLWRKNQSQTKPSRYSPEIGFCFATLRTCLRSPVYVSFAAPFATRLRPPVCDSFATPKVCDAFATRLRLVCDSSATRLRPPGLDLRALSVLVGFRTMGTIWSWFIFRTMGSEVACSQSLPPQRLAQRRPPGHAPGVSGYLQTCTVLPLTH